MPRERKLYLSEFLKRCENTKIIYIISYNKYGLGYENESFRNIEDIPKELFDKQVKQYYVCKNDDIDETPIVVITL